MKHIFIKVLSSVKDSVFPRRCTSCKKLFLIYEHKERGKGGESLKDVFRDVMKPFLCAGCLGEFIPVNSPLCPLCGLMFKERVSDDHHCGECIKTPRKFRMARAAGAYDKSLMSLVRSYKYNGRLQLAKPLSRLLFSLYKDIYQNNCSEVPPPDLIIPVPLHRKRLRQRGFNQSWLILKGWQDKPEIKDKKLSIRRDVLVRRKWTEPQAGLDRKKRKTNIKGAIALAPSADVKGKKILLIDDVFTTGATADECASVLLKNGASCVDVLTLARTF